MGRVIAAFSQYFDDEGVPLVNGWLRFLVSGSNNTDKDTYNDPIYQIPNANPLQLDAAGRCPDVFGEGDYRVISFVNDPEEEDSPGEQIQVFDPVTAQGTVEGGGGSGSVFDSWEPLVEYDLGDIIIRDLIYYRSLVASNVNLDPLLNEYAWERVDFLVWYNSTVSYTTGDMVYYTDNLWLSLVDSNQGNTPSTSPTYWRRVASGYKGVITQTGNYTITTADRDYIIGLTPAAVADATFDLPAMTVATSGFRIAIRNGSSYVLTLDAAGATAIWLNSSGLLDVEGGTLIELVYDSLCDCWAPVGNVGPVLGSQDIGTSTIPVHDIFSDGAVTADTLALITSLTVPTINATTFRIPSDQFMYFGDADEVSLSYTSATPAFDLNVPAATGYNFSIDSSPILSVDSGGIGIVGGLTIGSPADLTLSHDTSDGYLNCDTGAMVFQHEGTTVFSYDTPSYLYSSPPVYFTGEIVLTRTHGITFHEELFFETRIIDTSASPGLAIICYTAVSFETGGSFRWRILNTGEFVPLSVPHNIGSSALPVGSLYANSVFGVGTSVDIGPQDTEYFSITRVTEVLAGTWRLEIDFEGVSGARTYTLSVPV